LAGLCQGAAARGHGPHVTETLAIAVGIRRNTTIALEKSYYVVDEGVDLTLVSARYETSRVIDAGELGDPQRFTIRRIVVQVQVNTSHRILVNVDIGKIPLGRDLLGELLEPRLRGLLAHGGAAELGALGLKRSDVLLPDLDTLRDGHAGRSRAGRAIGLLKGKHVLRCVSDLGKLGEAGRVGAVRFSTTPEHRDGDGAPVPRRVGGPVVPPADVSLKARVGIP